MTSASPNPTRGQLFVVSGPSGAGKGTLLQSALQAIPSLMYSVSATSREARAGEENGVAYWFKTRQEFEAMAANGEFLEWAEFAGNYYGTHKATVDEQRRMGYHVVLEIETEGAKQVKALCPDAHFIFIAPPSMDELHKRLQRRATESEEIILRRMKEAEREMTEQHWFDVVIVNDRLETSIIEFNELMRSFIRH